MVAPYSPDTGYYIRRDAWFRTRLAAVEAFDLSNRSTELRKPHALLFPTVHQRHRLILWLGILDRVTQRDKVFPTLRDIAKDVVYRDADLGRAIEWKSSSHRRHTQRLVNEARFFMLGGYRLLLKGSLQKSALAGKSYQ